MDYALGLLLQLISTATISVANIFDNQLTRKIFSSIWSLVVLNGLVLIPLAPIFFLILRPSGITYSQLELLLGLGFIEVFYQYPYYKALRETDTSVVVSLFSFQRIFIPIFAYLIVGEKLAPVQYLGFVIIVVCSIAMTFKPASFKLNKALMYMIPVTFILSITSPLEKFGLSSLSWNTFFFWSLMLTLPYYFLVLVFVESSRKEVGDMVQHPFRKTYLLLYAQNTISFISGGFGIAALALLPVTILKAVSSIQAVIVHIMASFGSKRLHVADKETFSWAKIGLLICMSIGIILTIIPL